MDSVQARAMTYPELCAYTYGLSVDEEADRLSERFAKFYPQSGDWGAATQARANAHVLDDMRSAGYGTAQERAGLKLQADWWRDVAKEIAERTTEGVFWTVTI